ncbi:MAG: aromatic amino acid transport family protein [Chlamydiales bacterium]|nr:aromatic amino acid transport family protein [Chlamydiales bacterium]
MYVKKSRQLGGILLVSGTTIGAGMLALPVLTGMAGFYPSLLLFIFYWSMSLITAFLFLEANLWFPKPVNLVTISRYTLGRVGACVTWVFYLLLLYALTAAYLSASGSMFVELAAFLGFTDIPGWVQPLPFLLIFGLFIYLGTRHVDYLNRSLMIGLVIIYFLLVGLSSNTIDYVLLDRFEPKYLLGAIPVVVTSYGFHIIIPSLTTYLDRNVKALKRVIFIGSIIPLIVYLIWEYVVLGNVPVFGVFGLQEALQEGQTATYSLAGLLNNPLLATCARVFSFLAILTSFLGVGLSLSHFLSDGLKIKHTRSGKLISASCTFLPPLLFVFFYPRGFILALDYAGIFVAVLLGILPVMIVWKGRAQHKEDFVYKVGGGGFSFILPIIAYLFVIIIVIFNLRV